MKEASGEANITILTVLLIGIVATPLITNIMNSTSDQSCCTTAGGTWTGGSCQGGDQQTYDNCTQGTHAQ